MWRYSGTCSDRTRNAEVTKRPTAARPGTRLSSSTNTQALPLCLWMRPTARRCRTRPNKDGGWRSDDKGNTWRVVATCFNAGGCPENNRSMYYSQIRVDPSNPENVFVGGLNFSKSTDGGKKFTSLQQGIAHSDHHAIWIDAKNGNHFLIGNDGGLDVSYDQGVTWEFINTIPAAQFYSIRVDVRKPYYGYGS